MKTIGVIIGTEDEPVSKKYYQKNKSFLQVLKEYDISMNNILKAVEKFDVKTLVFYPNVDANNSKKLSHILRSTAEIVRHL